MHLYWLNLLAQAVSHNSNQGIDKYILGWRAPISEFIYVTVVAPYDLLD